MFLATSNRYQVKTSEKDSLNLVRSVLKANDARDVAGLKEEIGKALASVENIKTAS